MKYGAKGKIQIEKEMLEFFKNETMRSITELGEYRRRFCALHEEALRIYTEEDK